MDGNVEALVQIPECMGNVETLACNNEPKSNADDMMVLHLNMKESDSEHKNTGVGEINKLINSEFDPPEDFFDEMLQDDFLDSMAVVDTWKPDDNGGSDTEMKSDRVHDDSHKKSRDGRNSRRRATRRDSRDGQNSRNTDRNHQSNRDRENRKKMEISTDRNNRDRLKRESKEKNSDRSLNNRDRMNRQSREKSTDRNRLDRRSRDRSTNHRDTTNKRDRENRNKVETSTDKNNTDKLNRQSKERNSDRNQTETARDKSPDRNRDNRDRNSRNSRDRSADRNCSTRDKSSRRSREKTDRNLNNKDRSRQSRERSNGRNGRSGRHESKTEKDKGGETGKERSSGGRKEKGNAPKLDTCIKELDDLLPPGTEDEFALPPKDKTLKLEENLKKKISSSDKLLSFDNRRKFSSSNIDRGEKRHHSSVERISLLRSERDYKCGWDDRRERKVSNNDLHRVLKTDYQIERRRMRSISRERNSSLSRERKRSLSRERKRSLSRERKRSLSRERKRSLSRERKRSLSRERKRSLSRERKRSLSRERTSWLDHKRRSLSRDRMSRLVRKRRSLSREKHTDSVKDYGRHSPRDRQYRESLIKYRFAKDEFRSSSISKDRVRKSLPIAREEDLSPISDIERLSTPTLSSYGSPLSPERGRWQSHQRVRRYRRSRSRSRSRSFVSYTSLSSEPRYERPRRKRSPFLREIQRKLSEHDKKNAIKKLSNFSFAASFQSFSNQGCAAPVGYPPPSSYSQHPVTYPPTTSNGSTYPPTSVAPYVSQDSQIASAPPYLPVPPNFVEAQTPGSVPLNFSDTTNPHLPGPQPVQMPMQFPVSLHSQFPLVQQEVPLTVQSPSHLAPAHLLPSMPLPSPHLPVPSPGVPLPLIPTSVSQPLHESQPYSHMNSSEYMTESGKRLMKREGCSEVPPPPKISKMNETGAMDEQKVPVMPTRKEKLPDPELVARCEETLFTLQALSDPLFRTGPLVVQDYFRPLTKDQDIPEVIKKHQSPLLRQSAVELNFTNPQLFEWFQVSSEKSETAVKCSKEEDRVQCSACKERADKVMIWNSTQTESSVMCSVGVQVCLSEDTPRNSTWTRQDLGVDVSVADCSKSFYASEEYRHMQEDKNMFYGRDVSPAPQRSSFPGPRLPYSSGLYSKNSPSLAPIPRKGILKTSSNSVQEQRQKSSFLPEQSAASSQNDLLHTREMPNSLSHLSSYSQPFRLEYGSSYDRPQNPSAFPGKLNQAELVPQTTFDYRHSDKPTAILPNHFSRK